MITEAIANRPKAVNASLCLYLYKGKLVCGARIVMPDDAQFITHVPAERIAKGFNDKEWKLIVDKIKQLSESPETSNGKAVNANGKALSKAAKAEEQNFNERRKEERLYYRNRVWFAENLRQKLLSGQMLDVTSTSMALLCEEQEKKFEPNQKLAVRFNLPCFSSENCLKTVSFDRMGYVYRVNKQINNQSRVVVQFFKPLPFKPAKMGINEITAANQHVCAQS